MLHRFRIYRDPDAATSGDGGVAVADAPTDAGEASPEAAKTPESTEDVSPIEASPEQDAAIVEKMEANFKKQGDRYRATPEEMEAHKRHKAAQEKGEPKEEGQQKAPEAPKEIPDNLKPVLDAVGAKSIEELSPKVEGLAKQVRELNDFKAQGVQALKLHGASNFKELTEAIYQKQDKVFSDFLQGKPEAQKWAEKHRPDWLKVRPQAETQDGDDDILDTALDKKMAAKLQAMQQEFDRRIEETASKYEEDLKGYRENRKAEEQQAQFAEARASIGNEFRDLIDSNKDLQAEGVTAKQLADDILSYMDSADYDPQEAVDKAPGPLRPFIEMLEWCREMNQGIAPGSERFFTLDNAYAHFAVRGLPQRLAAARAEGRKELTKHKSTVGLSDKQGGRTQSNQSFSDDDLKAISTGKRPLPKEWTTVKNGQAVYDRNKVPADILDRMGSITVKRR